MGARNCDVMVAWWKRLIYSLVSAVLGAALAGAWVAAQQFLENAHGHLSAVALLTAILFFDPYVITLSLPGWVLAVPIVLLVRNIRGWRFWMYCAVGTFFGPFLILAVASYSAFRGPSLAGFPGNSMSTVYMAAAVSGLSSLIYLLLLRRGQTKAAYRASAAMV
jgi:hypothetical protein